MHLLNKFRVIFYLYFNYSMSFSTFLNCDWAMSSILTGCHMTFFFIWRYPFIHIKLQHHYLIQYFPSLFTILFQLNCVFNHERTIPILIRQVIWWILQYFQSEVFVFSDRHYVKHLHTLHNNLSIPFITSSSYLTLHQTAPDYCGFVPSEAKLFK